MRQGVAGQIDERSKPRTLAHRRWQQQLERFVHNIELTDRDSNAGIRSGDTGRILSGCLRQSILHCTILAIALSRRNSIPVSEAKVERYREYGYVIPDYWLSRDALRAISADYERLLASHPKFRD